MDLDEALDAVYGAPPDRFVEVRERLAKQLRAEDRPDGARQLKQQRKPTLPAWAVNQLAHRHREALDAAMDTGDLLRDHADDAREMRRIGDDLKRAIRDLRQVAAEELRSIGTDPESHLDEVEQTLMTAAVRPEDRDAVVRGRLRRPLPPAGFGGLAGLELAATAEDAADGGERRRALRRLEADISRLERRHAEQRRSAERARGRVEELEAELAAARQVAETESERAERTAEELEELQVRARELRD